MKNEVCDNTNINEFDNMNLLINSVEISKYICRAKLRNGDTAVDCTMGNGNDTAFLCSLVGKNGKVYAFDIQKSAVLNTEKRLKELGFFERAKIIHDGHQNIDKYISEKVRLIIFNLGYLPRGDHEITTKKETTIEAVQKCLSLLEPNGIILIVIYPGHENGKLEKDALDAFISGIDQREYNAVKIYFANQINDPPEIICIEKTCPK